MDEDFILCKNNQLQKFCSDSEIKEYVDFFLEYIHTSFMDNEFDCFVWAYKNMAHF